MTDPAKERRGAMVILLTAAGAMFVLVAILFWPARDPAEAVPDLPASPAPALAVGDPEPLDRSPHSSWWAGVRLRTTARFAPRPGARAVAKVDKRTPEGTANVLLVLARARDERGRVWVRARLPVLPNGTVGWVPRTALNGYWQVRTRLKVSLGKLRATLLRDGRPVFRARIGVGLPQWPTPRGEFYVRNKLVRYSSPFYGPLAFGTSARSPVLTDWPDGGFVGIHGTNRPGSLPGRVSHGCIRMRNSDIVRLGKLMPVGTPITVR